jgi:tetratricopeptide (TPR) repeat protein
MLKRFLSAVFLVAAFVVGVAAQEVEVDRYNINARIDAAANAVDVRATLSISNLAQSPKPKIYLGLTKLAKISAATVNGSSARVETAEDRRVTTLNQVIITPPSSIEAGAKATLELSYRIEAPESTPAIHIYPGEVLLTPAAVWVPMPSTSFALYGPTTAPFTLTVNATSSVGSFRALSSGAIKNDGQNATYEQSLNSLPLVVAGSFDPPVSSDRGGVKVEIYVQPGIVPVTSDTKPADPQAIIARLADETGRVIDFLTRTLGPPPTGATFRIISSARSGNLSQPGVLVLNEQVFRRSTLNSGVIEVLADAVARIWVDGRVRVRGQPARSAQEARAASKARSAAFLSDSLPRYLAVLYFENRFGKDVAQDLFTSMRWSYAPVAQSGRDAELGLQTLLLSNYSAAVFSKGPLVYRLLAETVGRDKFIAAIRSLVSGDQTRIITIEGLRTALTKGAPEVERVFQQWVDSIVEPDIIIGSALPSNKPGVQIINLRNLGTGDVTVNVLAVTASGKQVTASQTVPSENLISVEIPTAEKIVSVEVDPEKFIIQSNYDNDARDGDSKTTRSSAQTLLNSSIGAFNKTQYAEAETMLRQAVRSEPRNAVLHAWLARTLAAQRKMDEAASEASLVIKSDPPTGPALAWARVTQGQVAMARNQAAEAARHFRAAIGEADDAVAQLAAHEGLLQAERAAGTASQADESVRAFITQLDAAIKQPASDRLFSLVVKANLKRFVQGLTVSPPASWSTEILHVDVVDANRVLLYVGLKVKTEGKDQAGTAVFVLTRAANAWLLEEVPHQLFNVK